MTTVAGLDTSSAAGRRSEIDTRVAERAAPGPAARVPWVSWAAVVTIGAGIGVHLAAVFKELAARPGSDAGWANFTYSWLFLPVAAAWLLTPTSLAIAAQVVRSRHDRRRIEWLSALSGLLTSATIIAVDHLLGPGIGLYSDPARLLFVGAITLCGLPLVYLLLSYPRRRTLDAVGGN